MRDLAFVMAIAAAPALLGAEPADSLEAPPLSELVVTTGSNAAVDARLLPYTVSVVDRRELENAGSDQLLSVISGRVPSLFVTERGMMGFTVGSHGGSGHIKLRGVGGDRASGVLMMVDGQPQFAGIYSHHVADFYGKENVERVEVLRGPGSVLYGSNAMAGVINVVTRSASRRGTHGSFSAQYGSYNTLQTSADVAARYDRISALTTLSYDRTDGNIAGLTFEQWSGYVKAGYELSHAWTLTADATLARFRGNDPVYPTLSDPTSTAVYSQAIVRGEGSLAATNRYSSTDGTIRAYYSWGNHSIDDPRHFRSLDDRFGVMAYQNFRPWRGAMATGGFDFNSYSGRIPMSGGQTTSQAPMATMKRKTITEYSPYLALTQELADGLLTLSGGLRMANSDKFGTRWVPQAGITVSPAGGWTLKGSASMGYRNPSFRELYLYRMANPDLRPERMWNYEISVGKRFSRYLSATLTGYYSRGTNMIQEVASHNENTGRFINKGIELSAHSSPLDCLTLNASYSYLHSSVKQLAGAPRHQYFIGADWRIVRPVSLSAEVKGVSRLWIYESDPLQSYAVVDLKATYDPLPYLTLILRLDNITNASYTLSHGYPMPGFTAMGGFRLRF